MITLINGTDRKDHLQTIDEVYRLRSRVFLDRLQWDVAVEDGMERDRFDELNPLYVISQADNGRVRGTARLLPTTGPNMLGDVFSELLPDGQTVASPTIWESSRFAVDRVDLEVRSDHAINYVTAELLLAEAEIGLISGLEFIVSVVDVYMERVLNRAGCPCERIGNPQKIGRVTAVAGLWEIGDSLIDSLREASGISESVLPAMDRLPISMAA